MYYVAGFLTGIWVAQAGLLAELLVGAAVFVVLGVFAAQALLWVLGDAD